MRDIRCVWRCNRWVCEGEGVEVDSESVCVSVRVGGCICEDVYVKQEERYRACAVWMCEGVQCECVRMCSVDV